MNKIVRLAVARDARGCIAGRYVTLWATAWLMISAFAFPAQGQPKGCTGSGLENQKRGDLVQIAYSAKTKSNSFSWVRGTIHIDAPPQVVWDSVHVSRKKDPDLAYSRVLERSINEETYEEKFQLLPMLGSATCVLKDKETPYKRIDYQLVKSDRFKGMEGSWVFAASEDGKSTILELTSHIDIGLPCFQGFIDNNLAKKMERRLLHVKSLAEAVKLPVSISQARSEL